MKFFTIGYGNRLPKVFFGMIQENDIATVIDVREKPSGWSPFYRFTKKPDSGIVGKLAEASIDYVWIKELGNPFRNDESWRSSYSSLLDLNWSKIYTKLITVTFPVCLMCGCLKVEDCHREIIANKLEALGHGVRHL